MSAIDRYRERVRKVENDPAYLTEGVKLAFAEELCRLMEQSGISRAELAERIGSSRAYITRILRTDYNLTVETMVKLATALGARVTLGLTSQATSLRTHHAPMPAREARRAGRPAEFVVSDKPRRRKK